MSEFIKRKEFEQIFTPINASGKNIWVVHRVNELPSEIIDITLRLSALDFIKYIKLTDQILSASNELKGKTNNPLTTMNHETAIGIDIIYHVDYKVIDFCEINSPIKGNGSKMVDAVLNNFPEEWQAAVVMDWSGGFWDKMKKKYNKIEWIL